MNSIISEHPTTTPLLQPGYGSKQVRKAHPTVGMGVSAYLCSVVRGKGLHIKRGLSTLVGSR